jgi:hypothetical protein
VPYPAAFLKGEKEFLARIEARVPHLRAHFKRCEDIHPEERPQKLNARAREHGPRLWEWAGIDKAPHQSYGALNGMMADLAFRHPHDDYDLPVVLDLIRVIHLPDIIAGDIHGHGLTKAEVDETRSLAMRYMLGGFAPRKLWEAWQGADDPHFPEAQWTRDLRRIALAVTAAQYRAAHPAAAARIDALACALRAGLETAHGRAVMNDVMADALGWPRPAAPPSRGLTAG